MSKKKYTLILCGSMGLFVLAIVLFCVAFTIQESAVAGFWILLILSIASFVATMVLLFANRKEIIEYEQGVRTPSSKKAKKKKKSKKNDEESEVALADEQEQDEPVPEEKEDEISDENSEKTVDEKTNEDVDENTEKAEEAVEKIKPIEKDEAEDELVIIEDKEK